MDYGRPSGRRHTEDDDRRSTPRALWRRLVRPRLVSSGRASGRETGDGRDEAAAQHRGRLRTRQPARAGTCPKGTRTSAGTASPHPCSVIRFPDVRASDGGACYADALVRLPWSCRNDSPLTQGRTVNGPIKFKELPSTEELERAAEERQNRRKETAAALLDAAHELQSAQREVETRQAAYAAAWKQAVSGAWESTELTRQGFPKPTSSRTPNRRTRQMKTSTTPAPNSANETTHEDG